MNESDLYTPVETLLIKQGFTVQGEVKNLDIFGVKGTLTLAVELKLLMNLKLILQAVDRLKLVDLVYIAVPQRAIQSLKHDYQLLVGLLRKLEIGLITIEHDQAIVVIEAIPFDAKKSHQMNKRRQQGLMKEFVQRLNHPQVGGIKGQRLTAYRLRAIKVKEAMKDGQPYSIRQLKILTNVADVASILRHNYYGWFVHLARGQYGLSKQVQS
jgi:hypothetical protein